MAMSAPKFPQRLQIPTITNNRKHLTRFFSFPYRDKHFTQKRAAPIPAFCRCYLPSYSTRLSLRFGNEERRHMMQHHPFLAVGVGGEERAERIYPNVTTRHEKTPVGSLYFPLAMRRSEQTQPPSLNAASRWSPGSHSYALLRDGGVWPHTWVPGVTERCWTRTLGVWGGH